MNVTSSKPLKRSKTLTIIEEKKQKGNEILNDNKSKSRKNQIQINKHMQNLPNIREFLKDSSKKLIEIKQNKKNLIEEEKSTNQMERLFNILKKTERSINETNFIIKYLQRLPYMKKLLSLQKNKQTTFLNTLSIVLNYEMIEKNHVIVTFGERANKFYIVLQGHASVYVPIKKEYNMNQEDYITHLYRLRLYKEYGLITKITIENRHIYNISDQDIEFLYTELNKTSNKKRNTILEKSIKLANLNSIESINDNQKRLTLLNSYIIKLSGLNRSFHMDGNNKNNNENEINESENNNKLYSNKSIKNQNIYQNDNKYYLSIYNACSCEEYENRSFPLKLVQSNKKPKVNIFIYKRVGELIAGDKFGEIGLSNENLKRTASIVTNENTHLGVLEKNYYEEIVKDFTERMMKQDVLFLYNTNLFPSLEFINKNINNFQYVNFQRGEILIEQGNNNEFIYFLQCGDFDVNINLRFSDIINIFNDFSLIPRKMPMTKLEFLHEYGSESVHLWDKSQQYALYKINDIEVIGLEDGLFSSKLNSYYTVICNSSFSEGFKISKSYLKQLIQYRDDIKVLFDKFTLTKNTFLIDRLYDLEEKMISQIKKINSFSKKRQIDIKTSQNPISKCVFDEKRLNRTHIKTISITSNSKEINDIYKVRSILNNNSSANIMKNKEGNFSHNNNPYINTSLSNLHIHNSHIGKIEIFSNRETLNKEHSTNISNLVERHGRSVKSITISKSNIFNHNESKTSKFQYKTIFNHKSNISKKQKDSKYNTLFSSELTKNKVLNDQLTKEKFIEKVNYFETERNSLPYIKQKYQTIEIDEEIEKKKENSKIDFKKLALFMSNRRLSDLNEKDLEILKVMKKYNIKLKFK